ncbi:MAG TPA: glycerol kinase GlpK [Sedimentisphaerales bacterium]|nr:glycerol kinase GlpK [Sedimentisphaerales bacterium]
MAKEFVLAIDQGTSGTKAVIFDAAGRIVSKATASLKSYFPQPGFVEQDPMEIYQNVLDAAGAALTDFTDKGLASASIACCGISNQRETLVLWDRAGTPLAPAVVWQCKRSVDVCSRLKSEGLESEVTKRTGLIIDPYFSGTKLIWLYENRQSVRQAIDSGNAMFGTVDAWLLYKLTHNLSYATDYTNASRTLLFNIDTLNWDQHLLEAFGLKNLRLPKVRPSSHAFGKTDFGGLLPQGVEITGMIGDSHAAAFGEGCIASGTAKATLGTGCSVMLNTGSKRIDSRHGMMTAICWSVQGRVDYALEGVIVTCGATINWLKEQFGLFSSSKDTEKLALAVEDSGGVTFIPAFSGMGAPHWKMDARAAIAGLTFGSTKEHIVRAALESIACQIKDVIAAMEEDSGLELAQLNVDGGMTGNRFVVQMIADLLDCTVANIGMEEVSALGAAYMAGLKSGIWQDIDHLPSQEVSTSFLSGSPGEAAATEAYARWQKTLRKIL